MHISLHDTRTHRAQKISLLCCAGGTHLIKSVIPLDLLWGISPLGILLLTFSHLNNSQINRKWISHALAWRRLCGWGVHRCFNSLLVVVVASLSNSQGERWKAVWLAIIFFCHRGFVFSIWNAEFQRWFQETSKTVSKVLMKIWGKLRAWIHYIHNGWVIRITKIYHFKNPPTMALHFYYCEWGMDV